jgi:hypothetical protein
MRVNVSWRQLASDQPAQIGLVVEGKAELFAMVS